MTGGTPRTRTRTTAATATTALALAVLLAGCGVLEEDPVATAPTVTAATPAAVATVDCASLERCFGRAQMPAFLAEAVPLVRDWARAAVPSAQDPDGVELVASGDTVGSECGDVTDSDFAYCPGDRTIWVGEATLWEFYHDQGDAAAVLALAHEWGHHLQELAGVPLDDTDQATSIEVENQADCVAGAVEGHLLEEGLFEDDDVDDVDALLAAIAENEDDPDREHGTLEERTQALQSGVDGGLDACSTLFPDTPLG